VEAEFEEVCSERRVVDSIILPLQSVGASEGENDSYLSGHRLEESCDNLPAMITHRL
jgi:uncharacterized protein related to proFAR isomerase